MQKEFRNKQSDQGSICHCEQSRAIHKTRNPHVISRLTGNPRNKDFNTFWMPDRVGHDMDRGRGQSGRSMVEMLGTLAIVGVLSAGAIGGYSYAMNKHRTNELIYEATKRAQWVSTQLELNSNPSLNTFGTDSFGGGTFTGEVVQLENGQIGIKVAGLKEAVCQNILNSIGDNTVIREMQDVNCNDDNGTATLVFNRDLSTSDSEVPSVEPEVSGEVSEQATETANPETVPSDRKVHCNDHGEWDGNACDCDAGYDGETCSIEINAQPDEPEETATGTGDSEPEETTTANHDCGEHGYWEQAYNNGAGGCDCISGWVGSDCSQTARAACSDHGTFIVDTSRPSGGFCSCESGWGGSDCSEDHTCSGHGNWNGRCYCDAGWGGEDCSKCSGHGNWDGSSCSCHGGWHGTDCSEDDCNGHGWFDILTFGCSCDSGWGGSDCLLDAREACSNHGTWNGTNCTCDTGWGGDDCSQACVHGSWNWGAGRCSCESGWGGADCSEDLRTRCSNHGTWNGLYCNCDSSWDGNNCSINGREIYCNNHGTWEIMSCACDSGWTGDDCSVPHPCSGHGTWIINTGKPNGGFCSCDSGYTGDDCSTPN